MAQTITIDSAGRVVIPKDIRRRLRLRGGSRLQIRTDGDKVVLEPEEVSDGVVEDGGLLVATGRLADEWLDHRGQDHQARIRQRALQFVGEIRGPDPERAGRVRELVRQSLRRHRA